MSRKRTLKLVTPPSDYVIARWKRTRFWSITLHGELIALCVYRKGARSVVTHLEERDTLKARFGALRLLEDLIEPLTATSRR